MDSKLANELLGFGLRQGLSKASIVQMRQALSDKRSLSAALRDLLDNDCVTEDQSRFLLMAAFGLSIGDLQLTRMWISRRISDDEFDKHLLEKIEEQESAED